MTEPCRALRGLLEAVVREYRRILGRNLAGIYLHGSAAFGCFRWQTSDIDLLVAVHAPPSSCQRKGWCAPCWRRAPLRRPPGSR